MEGVLIVNMGGPQTLSGMKQFLWNMFTDKHILPFVKPFRYFLATVITNARYKKSWAKYQLIGGTPLMKSTDILAEMLGKELADYSIKVAYSYNDPNIDAQLKAFATEGVKTVHVVSLYPHYSITTLQSVRDDAEAAAAHYGLKVETALPYFQHPAYIRFWTKAIEAHLTMAQYEKPLLVFSGHSIPNIFLKKGDCYPKEIAESARLIAQAVGCEHRVSYQSQIGKKWLGPVTEDLIATLAAEGRDEIVLIPISFVNENLETLYDMDKVILPEARQKLGLKHISRVAVPDGDADFVTALADAVRNAQYYGKGHTCSLCQKSLD